MGGCRSAAPCVKMRAGRIRGAQRYTVPVIVDAAPADRPAADRGGERIDGVVPVGGSGRSRRREGKAYPEADCAWLPRTRGSGARVRGGAAGEFRGRAG